jgi:PAS domain S-box-containing protein
VVKWKHEAGYFLLGLVSLATVTGLYLWLDVPLVSAAFTYLVVLVLLSLVSNFSSLIVLCFIGAGCLNYFFAPPIYTFRLDYPQDLITISAFVIISLLINFLVTRVRVEQRDHRRTCETLRDANQRLEVTNKTLRIENEERKQAEHALRESEDTLRQIFETVPGLIWSADPAGKPTQFNQRLLDYSGMRLEDFQHGAWEAFLHPADFPETARAFYQAIQTGTSYEAVHRLRRADGEYRWHHARAEPLRDRQGRIVQWYGLSVDIDDAKKAEDRIRRSETYLAEAQSLSHTGTAVYNDTTILYLSDETYRIFGFDPRKELPSREAALQRIHPDDRERAQEVARRGMRQKKDYKFEFRLGLPATIKYIEGIAHPKFSASGELVEVVGTIIDVTERKRAEATLLESELKLRQIIETVPSLLWSTGPDGEVTYINQRILDYLGIRLEDFRHRGWEAFLHPADLPETARAFYQAIQTGTSHQSVHRVRRADGEYRWHQARAEPLRDRQGCIIQWYGLSVDIDDAKKAEEALRESEARSRSAIDGIAALVSILAPNGKLETVNRQLLEYFGRPLEWLKNWGTTDAVHPEDLPRILELF